MKHRINLAALCLSAALLLTGCGEKPQEEIRDDVTAVTVNEETFTLEEYKLAFRYSEGMHAMQMAMSGQSQAQAMADETLKAQLQEAVTDMTRDQLTYMGVLRGMMKEAGLELDEEELDSLMAQQDELMGGPERAELFMTQMGVTREEFRWVATMDEMMRQLGNYHLEQLDDKGFGRFEEEFLRCKHVLVMDQEGTDEKEALANEIADKAQSGADFDALIAQYGEDPGMTEFPEGYVFTEGMMVDPFYQGTLALEENAVSDPVRSDIGWHIILRLPLRDEDFQANREQIMNLVLADVVEPLVDEAEVTVSDEAAAVTFDMVAEDKPAKPAGSEEEIPAPKEVTYVLDAENKVYHKPDCSLIKKVDEDSRLDFYEAKEALEEQGYIPCKKCKP